MPIHNRRGIFYEEYFFSYRGNRVSRTTQRCPNKVRWHKYRRCMFRGSVIKDMRKDPVEEAKKKKGSILPERWEEESEAKPRREYLGVVTHDVAMELSVMNWRVRKEPSCPVADLEGVNWSRGIVLLRERWRELGEPDAKGSAKRRERRWRTNTSWMLRSPLSFHFFFVFIIYTYTCILCICSLRSSLLVSRLRVSAAAVLFHRAPSTWIRREAEIHRRPFLRFSSIPRLNRTLLYHCLSLFLILHLLHRVFRTGISCAQAWEYSTSLYSTVAIDTDDVNTTKNLYKKILQF